MEASGLLSPHLGWMRWLCPSSASQEHRVHSRQAPFLHCSALVQWVWALPWRVETRSDKRLCIARFMAPNRMGERRNLMLVQLNTECSISTRCSPSLLSPRAVFLGSSSGYRRGVSRYAGYSANSKWVRRLGPASVPRCGMAATGARTLSDLLSLVLLSHVDISS